MEIWDAKGNKVLDSVVTQNAEHVEEMMQSDYVSLQWVSNVKRVLPAGAYIIPFDDGVRYMLLDPYTPDQNNTDEFTYSPQFQHPKMYLGKVPYTRASKDTEGNDINLLEWDYKGYLTTFLSDLCEFITKTFTDEGITTDKFSYSILGDIEDNITFSISNNDILSVLSNVCNTLDCEWHIDWEQRRLYLGNIRFDKNEGSVLELTSGVNVGMASVSSQRDTHFNVYLPQGSTRNMAAATTDGSYYATNRRLELDTEKYPDGKIYTDGEGNVVTKAQFLETGLPKLVQTLMLDEIYPKIDLYVYDVRNRERYLLDDNGEKVIDHYDGETPVYKRYAVWYMRLAYPIYNTNGTIRSWKDATLGDTFKLIDGYTLMCSFGANTDSTLTSPLAGREFELNYVETDKEAKELSAKADSDKGDTGVEVKKGDYEIIYTTEGNLIIPTTEEQGLVPKGDSSPSKNGNKVTIFNVVMGEDFIKAAQNDLEVAAIREIKKQYSDLNQYTFNSDNVAFKKDMPSLYIGRSVRYNDGVGNTLDTRIMKLTTKLDFPFMVEITVGNKVLKGSTSQLKTDVQMILSGNRQTASNGITESVVRSLIKGFGGANFLSKVNDDTARGIITFLQGTNWGSFTSETGAAMTVDPTTGQTYMEVDRLKVRLKAFFEQLEVQKVGYVGGKIVVSKGQGVNILDVEEIYDSEGNLSAYRCYFLGEQEGRRINNLLRVNDQMICKDENISEGSTDGATNKYYWRLATAVSSDVVKRGNNVCHWVDLSATDYDTISDNIPEIGDTICQLGNRNDIDRQGAEVLSVVDANSPSFTIYAGIDSYSLVNKEYIDMGVSEGKAYCNIYGSTYIGDRERKTGYLRWNDDTKTFEIKGTIDISSPLSSGGTIGGAIDNAANAYKDDFSSFTSNVNEIIGGFQAQIDGVIETWFFDKDNPELTDEPAVNWTDNDTKKRHLGDLYYSKSGLAYRFQKEGDIYKWVQIDDTAITSALKEAKEAKDAAAAAQGTADTAQNTAKSKMKVFVNTPTNSDEYSIGDMWVNATYPADGSTYNNEILHCVTDKAAGEAFSISHWAQSSNIKTQFNNFVNNTYTEDKKDFYNQLDGKVETWYQPDDPKNKWVAADYSKHTGDIWYNGSTNKAYRWTGTAWVELKDQAAIDAKALAESKRRVFTTTTLPTPPYDEKDLWVQGENGDIMVCVIPRAAGATASASDWAKASKYTDDSALNTFINEYKAQIADFSQQLDGKIETWYYPYVPETSNEPASKWTADEKTSHSGDLFYNTDTGVAYRWTGTAWEILKDKEVQTALNNAKTAQDTADNKRRVFLSQPTVPYDAGDLWVSDTANGKVTKVCVNGKTTGTFSTEDWKESDDAALNSFSSTITKSIEGIESQLDKKAETWYQASDPSTAWTTADLKKEHVGDLWYKTTDNTTWYYDGTDWVQQNVPTEVFDKIDGKAAIYVSKPSSYRVNDLWILEAAYTLSGVLYTKGTLVVATATSNTFNAAHWTEKVKYTDDTKANEALTKVGDLQTDVTELGDSFKTLTDFTLPALSDGIITTSEKENIRQALMQVQKECVDVINAYTNLTVNYESIYDKIAADVRTNFATAYTNLMGSATLSSDGTITYTSGQGGAYGALVDNINTLLNKDGNLTTNEIATINNNIANFNIKYNDFQNRLVVVRNDIEKTLDTRITEVDEQLGGYAYLKKIVGGKTTIDGGLVLTTMLGTGYEVTGGAYQIMSGISGLYETAKSVAIWAGGSMIDKFVYYDAESGKFNVPDDVKPANFLVRMDGTGYAAGGNFWWDNDGKIHADPQSFIINEQYVGNIMQLFELHYREAGKTDFTNVDYVTPTRMFNGLELSDKGLQIGDTAKLYVKNGVLFIEGDLAVTGGITMYASDGVKSGMIDQVYAVLDQGLFSIKNGVITITGEIGSGTVKGIAIKGTQYDPDTNGIIALTLNWGDLTGVPETFTPSAHTHDDRYYIKSEIDTKLGLKLDTSLKGAANGLATLDASGKVPSAQLPSYVDDVLEYTNKASFPTTGESGKIYIDQTTNLTYRWGGTSYVEISQSLALGETSSTAYAGNKGKQNAADIAALKKGKADKATTLAGYGITDAYTKTQTYTQAEVNTKLTDGSVTKVGTADVGSTTKPIYLKAGVPTAVGTSLAVDITGNSATTSKLKTAVTLWGQSFDGSKAITGNLTNVGTITPTGEDLKVVGNLIVTGGIVMYADDGASIASGFAELLAAHIDGVTIKYNESQQKIYSVMTGIKVNGTTYKPSETDGYITIPDYPTSLDWANIENKPSTFTPASHTHTFASLTSKPTTLSGYGITDAKIVNGVITLGTATITPLTAHQTVTLASGTNNGTLKLTVGSTTTDNIAVKGLGSAAYTASSAYAAASHTHSDYVTALGTNGNYLTWTKNGSTSNITVPYATGSSKLMYHSLIGYRTDFDSFTGENAIKVALFQNRGTDDEGLVPPFGDGSLISFPWFNDNKYGAQLAVEDSGQTNHLAIRNKNGSNTWGAWAIILTSANYNLYSPKLDGTGASGTWGISVSGNAATASKWATARTLTLSGSVTGSVSIDGSGNVTLATTTNHTHSYLPLAGGTMNADVRISYDSAGDLYIGREDNEGYVYFQDIASQSGADYWHISQAGEALFKERVTAPIFNGALNGNAATASKITDITASDSASSTNTWRRVWFAYDDNVTGRPAYSDNFCYQVSTNTLKVGTLSGNAATATKLAATKTLWGQSFDGSANVSGDMSSVGQITFSTLSGTNGRALLYQQMADNDFFRIYCGGTGSNAGYAEIATADDGTEPIYVRQYSGTFTTLTRTLTLLDGNGNTSLPGTLTAPNATISSTLRVGAIPVTNSSTGILKIDGNLVVTGGITMYATDGVASGLMEQILVDGTTIGKKADGTLYAINTGNVRSIVMGSTTYTPNSSGAVTLPEKVTWANIEGKPSTFNPSAHAHVISDITNLQATLDGKAAASHTHEYLPLSGGALTGSVSLKETCNILLRPNNPSYTSGIGHDIAGNECVAIWAKNSMTRLRWHAGVDMSTMAVGTMMNITPDFEISKASGSAIGYIAGNTILHSGNYNSYAPTLTGGGASGTWGISISGNATTASSLKNNRLTNSDTLNAYIDGRFNYVNADDPVGAYSTNAVVLSFANRNYDVFQLAMAYNAGNEGLAYRRLGISGGSVEENTGWQQILTTANYNSYVPTKTGGGASGTWGISISGNAATSSKCNGVIPEWIGEIAWANTSWIAAWNSDGTKIKALSKSSFAAAGHTHNYAGSDSAGGVAISSNCLYYTGTGSSVLTAYQTGNAFMGSDDSWASYIICNHGDGSSYFNQTIRMPFWGVPQYQRLEHGTYSGWKTFITSENISSQSVNYSSSAGNSDTVDGLHAAQISGTATYSTWQKTTTSGIAWFPIYEILDSTDGSAIFIVRAIYHSSVIFTVTRGYINSGVSINILGGGGSFNGSYAYIRGVRYVNGAIEIGLNAAATNIGVGVKVISSMGSVSLKSSLVEDTTSDSDATVVYTGLDVERIGIRANNFYGALTGNAATATNADTVDGYHASCADNKPWGTIPVINSGGWMDVGKQFEFHFDNSTGSDYSTVLRCTGNYSNVVDLPSNSGTLALTTDNVASASKWATARTLTLTGSVIGSVSIDGSGNVSLATTTNHTHAYLPLAGGTMTGTINANDNTQNTGIKFKSNNANLNALSNQHLILGTAIRFGAYGTWDWDAWAGLKYDHATKTIYLGISDGTVFNANSAQTGGTLSLPAISTVKVDANTRIAQANGSLYIGSSSNTGWVYLQDMASQNGTMYWTLTQTGYLTAKGVTLSEKLNSSVSSGTYIAANRGTAIINSTAAAGFNMLARMKSTNGVFIHGVNSNAYCFYYTADSTISADTDTTSKQHFRLQENGYIYSNTLLPLGTNNIGSNSTRWNSGYFLNVVHVGPSSNSASAGGVNAGMYGSGFIELSNSKPYIDFHYAQSTSNYTTRIVATAADCLAISSHLYVGGESATSYMFRVEGTAYTKNHDCQGQFAVLDSSSNVTAKITPAGDMVVSGGITMYSDVRKKDIISDELLSVKSIADAPLFAFNYKSDEAKRLHTGTSAQYWHGAYGDMFGYKDEEGFYTLEYQNLGVAMGISLAREIITFEGAFKKYESKTDKKIRLMKKKINDLEARIKELEGSMEERRTA